MFGLYYLMRNIIVSIAAFGGTRPRDAGRWAGAGLLVVGAAVVIPYRPAADVFGFRPPPPPVLAMIAVIVALYVASAEAPKRLSYGAVKA
jgi:Mg2+-importing ATPase